MNVLRIINRIVAASALTIASALIFAASAAADPPARVARLAYTSGVVSFAPAGESEWVPATVNRPLYIGDSLWTDPQARAELQIGAAQVRIRGDTSLSVLNFDDRIAQFNLTQGTVSVRVWDMAPGSTVEIDTPVLAFSIQRPGAYRIDVDPSGQSTTVAVRNGQAVVYGQDASSYLVGANQSYTFAGSLSDFRVVQLGPLDEFDRWSADRDRRWSQSRSVRYVSRETIGFEDLDEHGQWRTVQGYGNVWVPSVAPGWAPYRDGHWAWVEPWGWTWIDDAPWGFTVSHYGRWAYVGNNWCWVPGPIQSRPVYAPALVAFVGGASLSGGGVAWFPLGPREVYRPSYTVSRNYFTAVNTSNTVIDTSVVTRVYGNANAANVTYANRHIPGAVVAVPARAFVQAQPVKSARVQVPPEVVQRAPVMPAVQVAPERTSVLGHATPSRSVPPAAALSRTVVARTQPASAPAPVEARQAPPGQPGASGAAPGRAQQPERAEQRTVPTREGPKVVVVNPSAGAPRPLPQNTTGAAPGVTPGPTITTRSGEVVPRGVQGNPPAAATNAEPPAAPSQPPSATAPAQPREAPGRANELVRERNIAPPVASPGVTNSEAARAQAQAQQQQAQQAREAQARQQAEQAKAAQAQQQQAQQAQQAREAQARQQAEQAKSAQAQQQAQQSQQAREAQARQQAEQAKSAQAQQQQQQREAQARQQAEQAKASQAQQQQAREAQARQQAEQARAAQAQQQQQLQQQQQVQQREAQARQQAEQSKAAQAQQQQALQAQQREAQARQQAEQAKAAQAQQQQQRQQQQQQQQAQQREAQARQQAEQAKAMQAQQQQTQQAQAREVQARQQAEQARAAQAQQQQAQQAQAREVQARQQAEQARAMQAQQQQAQQAQARAAQAQQQARQQPEQGKGAPEGKGKDEKRND